MVAGGAVRAAAKQEPAEGELCMSCFIVKPIAGDCAICD